MSLTDHYLILEVEITASDAEIKQAFRRLAKKFHPDKNPGREKSVEQKFKKIIAAYKVLGNRRSRDIYDRRFKASSDHTQDRRRNNLRRKAKHDITYMCQLILFELLNKNAQSALQIYEGLISENPHFSLHTYMSDADVRDCEFLLAEAYHQRGKLSKAAQLYERILDQEKRKAYFRGFAQEIEIMLKDVYTQRITKSGSSEDIRANMEKLLAMDLPRREIAWVHKKAAEAYYRTSDIDRAKRTLEQAFQINPRLPGAKKISRKLGIKDSSDIHLKTKINP